MAAANPTPVLRDDVLYLGDNGQCLCGRHSGATARYTGRDLSGVPVTPSTRRLTREVGDTSVIRCEVPSCTVRPPA